MKAATALGHLSFARPCADTEHEATGQLRAAAVQALLGTAGTKSQQLQFAVGEALCFAFGGVAAHKVQVCIQTRTTMCPTTLVLNIADHAMLPAEPAVMTSVFSLKHPRWHMTQGLPTHLDIRIYITAHAGLLTQPGQEGQLPSQASQCTVWVLVMMNGRLMLLYQCLVSRRPPQQVVGMHSECRLAL